ncbi:MAG TPA: OmpA family protein [Xanthobacteraceae bacterium]|nr:OmpA family protein [Xanthobacteraceae bacterium]
MRSVLIRLCTIAAFVIAGLGSASAQQWVLNGGASHFYMQTAKAGSILEIHQFTGLEGAIGNDGDAEVKIDLTSVSSGIDVRDVRMRFLLFETYKFPLAEVRTHLDMGRLQDLTRQTRIIYPLHFTLSMHGMSKEFETLVYVTRLSDRSVSVATVKPIIVSTDDFALTAGLAKLSEAINGTPIVSGATFTFDLLFETGDRIATVEEEQHEAEERHMQEERRAISAEECETRFGVISTTGAIYFKTGSAELDHASDPLLDSVADITNRCPGVKVEVSGHTDSTGTPQGNQELSFARARSVLDFLVQRGVRPERITAIGYGDTRPIASNATDEGRARNRRIEFRVVR